MKKQKPIDQAVGFVHSKANARATGSWRYDAGQKLLLLESFQACPEMNQQVAEGFPAATAEVPVTDTGLGIVLAARAMSVTEYRAIDLPPETGSGYWLRGFEADRSVAVPQIDNQGNLIRILSVAVTGLDKPFEDYAELIRRAYAIFIDQPE
ncbi:MAG: hypothetical protein ACKO5E_22210 [bacterium]